VAASGPRASGETFRVVAVPTGTSMLKPEVVEGRGLQSGDRNAIVVNGTLADKEPALKVGEEVVLRMGHRGLPWRVVGRVREPFSPPGAYVPKSTIDELGGHDDATNSVRIALEAKDPEAVAAFRERLDPRLEGEGVRLASSSTKGDGRYAFDQHMLMIYVFLIVMSAILAGVGGLGLMTTMSLNVLERRREMGVLRAIGATPSMVFLLVVAEGAFVGLSSWALAAILAWPVSKVLGEVLVMLMFKSGLDFFFDPAGLLIWLGLSAFLGAAASFLPAWQASRCSVREAIGYE
jgi:putative ABC transport system permease protein